MCATVIRERELSDAEGHNRATHPHPKYKATEIPKYKATEIQRYRNRERIASRRGHIIASHPWPTCSLTHELTTI